MTSSKQYSGEDPIFEEGDVFKITVPLNDSYSYDTNIDSQESSVNKNGTRNGTRNEEFKSTLIKLIRDNDKISRQELAEAVGLSIRSVTRKLSEIPNIQYVGKGKNGH